MDYRTPSADLDGYVPFPPERARAYQAAGHWRNVTLHDVLDRTAEATPEAPFLVGPDGVRTYGQVVERSRRVAGFLAAELGLEPLDRLVLQVDNRPAFVELLFGCSRAGVVPAMALPRHREAEARHVVERTDARAYVALGGDVADFDFTAMVDGVAGDADSLEHLIAVTGDGSSPSGWIDYDAVRSADEAGATLPAVNPADPALLLLSGGTTGLPKLIPRTHNDYGCQWDRWEAVIGVEPDWTLLSWLPIGHNATLNSVLGGAVATGAAMAVEPRLKTGPLLERTVADDVDYLVTVPTQLVDVIEFDGIESYDLSGVSAVMSGGQKVPPRLVEALADRWGIGLVNIFGMAEGPMICTRPDDPRPVQAETVGRPIFPEADEFRVVDESRAPVPDGTPGELAARGPGIIPGYFRNPEENAERFDDDGWFYTGDVVERDGDGNLRVHGRLDDTIIRGGENIYAPGVEDAVIAHPAVANVAVVGMPDERLGERPCAFVVAEAGRDPPTVEELGAFLAEAGVAVFKRPERVAVVDSLPRTEVDKVDKVALRDRIAETLRAEGALPPES